MFCNKIVYKLLHMHQHNRACVCARAMKEPGICSDYLGITIIKPEAIFRIESVPLTSRRQALSVAGCVCVVLLAKVIEQNNCCNVAPVTLPLAITITVLPHDDCNQGARS